MPTGLPLCQSRPRQQTASRPASAETARSQSPEQPIAGHGSFTDLVARATLPEPPVSARLDTPLITGSSPKGAAPPAIPAPDSAADTAEHDDTTPAEPAITATVMVPSAASDMNSPTASAEESAPSPAAAEAVPAEASAADAAITPTTPPPATLAPAPALNPSTIAMPHTDDAPPSWATGAAAQRFAPARQENEAPEHAEDAPGLPTKANANVETTDRAAAPHLALPPAERPVTGQPSEPAPTPYPTIEAATAHASGLPILETPDRPASQLRPPVAIADIPVAIATLARNGERTFDIRLDPAELGRIDVSLTIDRDGAIRTHIVVERPETVQMLRNDSQRLEQALGEAGLRTDPAGIGVSLRNGGQQQSPGHSPGHSRQLDVIAQGEPAADLARRTLPYQQVVGMTQRLDLTL